MPHPSGIEYVAIEIDALETALQSDCERKALSGVRRHSSGVMRAQERKTAIQPRVPAPMYFQAPVVPRSQLPLPQQDPGEAAAEHLDGGALGLNQGDRDGRTRGIASRGARWLEIRLAPVRGRRDPPPFIASHADIEQ